MKRLALLLILAVSFSLVACGAQKPSPGAATWNAAKWNSAAWAR